MMMKSVLSILLTLIGVCCCPVLANAFFLSPATKRALTSLQGGSVAKQQYRRLYSSNSDTARVEPKVTSKKQSKDMTTKKKTSFALDPNKRPVAAKTLSPLAFFQSMDGIVFFSYLCNVVALSLPVILLPMAASEYIVGTTSGKLSSAQVASTVAAVSSIATLGGAIGKFVNGFICKELGTYVCSKVYLAGLSVCSLAFSFCSSPNTLGITYGGMEFFASMQWASLSVMLSNFYSFDKKKLASALTTLGLSSTTGMILAKTLGTTLGTAFQWRTVARFGAIMAFLGSIVISQAPGNTNITIIIESKQDKKMPLLQSIQESLRAILTSKLFWLLGLAHGMAFLTRGTERILGTFYASVANLPQHVAGGLTLSITLGLIYGLVSGSRKFPALKPEQQKAFLASRYRKSFASTVGLALVASPLGSMLGNNNIVKAALVALLSASMIANVAFQYYQFPALIGNEFGQHKAVCISFLDGFGFLLSAPILLTCGKLVESVGWSSAWGLLSVLFGLAGIVMVKSIGPVLAEPKKAS